MSLNRPQKIARVAQAGIASAALWTAVGASAQSIEPARIVAPHLLSVAAPAAMPTATPAVVAPQARPVPAPSTPTQAQPVTCSAPNELAQLDRPLLRTSRRLAGGEPLTIVAIGSSSTAGAGASSPDASYPSQLSVELKKRFPAVDITVLNRGVNGEETGDMIARFETGVFPAHPQLVLWQVGTNSVLRDRPLQPHEKQLEEGIDELKATRSDVVLIDPQFSPTVIAKAETSDMVDQIALIAKEKNVDLFRRFAAMRDWHEVQHLPFEAFVSPDGLHMNDWGYACWAKIMAKAIADAATRPVASAAVHSAR